LDNEMDEKFNNFENMLNENMMGMWSQGILEENQ
jgi:hypothetical protein